MIIFIYNYIWMEYIIPWYKKSLMLNTIILDLNGTISIDGKLIPWVKDKILALKKEWWTVLLCSGDTQWTAAKTAKWLWATLHICKNQNDKKNILKEYKTKHCVAIGNGHIDIKLMEKCALSIAVIQAEWCYSKAILSSDIVCLTIVDALDILLMPKRLIATLRK